MTDYNRFIRLCNVTLGGLIGFLIAVPILPLIGSAVGGVVTLVISTTLGLAVGGKRRESRAFLYFALVSTVVLASIVSSSVFSPERLPPTDATGEAAKTPDI